MREGEMSTKEKIIQVSLELFANQGYHKTSINQIARAIGVSKSLIYNYFESKDQLLLHIIEDFMERNMAKLPGGSIQNLNSVDDLIDYLRVIKEDAKSQPAYYRLLIMLTLQGTVKDKLMADILEKQQKLLPQIHAFFEKNHVPNPQIATYVFGAILDGIILHFLYMEEKYPIDEVFEFYASRL